MRISQSPSMEDIVEAAQEVVKLVPQVRVQRLHVAVPQFRRGAAEVGRLRPFERVQHRTAERKVELPLLPEATIEVASFTPRERGQKRPAKHIVDGSTSQSACRPPGSRFSMFSRRRLQSAQDLKQGPNLAEHQGAVSRCSRAADDGSAQDLERRLDFAANQGSDSRGSRAEDDETVGRRVEDRFSKKNRAANFRAAR